MSKTGPDRTDSRRSEAKIWTRFTLELTDALMEAQLRAHKEMSHAYNSMSLAFTRYSAEDSAGPATNFQNRTTC